MEKIRLKNTDLSVSRIGFGCGPLGSMEWGEINQKDLMKVVGRALDSGINYFDTADIYGLGRSEELLSKALGPNIKDAIISTKFGVNWKKNLTNSRAKTFYDSSPKRVKAALEDSLKRLNLDCIPLYFIHWPDPNTPFTDTIKVLQDAKREGKIKYLGLSNFSLSQIQEINKELNISVIQSQTNLIEDKTSDDLIQFCHEENINIMIHGALAQGLLSGNYLKDFELNNNDNRNGLEHFKKENINNYNQLFSILKSLSARYSISYSQIALRWVLEKEHVSSVICGIKNDMQLADSSKCLEWKIDTKDFDFFNKKKEN